MWRETIGQLERFEPNTVITAEMLKSVGADLVIVGHSERRRYYGETDELVNKKIKQAHKNGLIAVACLADDDLFDAIYIQYCNLNGQPILSSLAEDKLNREIKLDRFSSEEPVKFNKFFNNKDVRLMAIIERLIAHGELVRSDYNQNISTNEGALIGANMNEAVIWFKNPENASAVNAYHNKLKNI